MRKFVRYQCCSLALFQGKNLTFPTFHSAASSLVAPDRLTDFLPNIVDEKRISGFLTGMLYTAFFSICPQIFKALSNFGSGASSVKHAETSALRYYWIFMLATAFTGTSLATVVIEGLYYNINVAEEAREVLRTVASTIPTTVGSTWLNWLIVRYAVTLPTNYLLQFPTIFFRIIQFKCCSRMAAGGGPGGPVPYRIYVDSGVAFLCVIGLAPVCPLVAPAAMLYFLVATPMFRWLLIFSYRPQFDGGGFRWPHLHNIFISSMLWSQFLLAVMMALKKAWGATFLAGIALIPTYTFSLIVKDRFERCYRYVMEKEFCFILASPFLISYMPMYFHNALTTPETRPSYRPVSWMDGIANLERLWKSVKRTGDGW